VPFNGDDLVAVLDKDSNKIYTGVSYICKGIGLSKSQKDTQAQNVQNDLVLKKGCLKFQAGVFDPNNPTIAIDIDFLPLWLAKIKITPTMQKEQPEITKKLIQYQLKAKDVLAEAFINSNPYKHMSKELQAILMLDQKTQKIESKVSTLEDNVKDIKENSPLYNIECDELQGIVKKVGVKVLGGYGTPAYKNNSLRQKVYRDIQSQLRREFDVKKYKAIKRCQLNKAEEIVNAYTVPTVLKDEITMINNQVKFTVVRGNN
jgi:hypothetical protein